MIQAAATTLELVENLSFAASITQQKKEEKNVG